MFKLTLRRKIITFFLLVGLLPLVIIIFLAFTQIPSSLRNTVGDHLFSLAEETIFTVDELIEDARTQIESLAEDPIIKSKEITAREKRLEMRKRQDLVKIFEDTTLIDLDGNVIISTTYKHRGEWKDKEWFLEAKEGKFSISPMHVILLPHKTILVFTAPILDENGEVVQVIAGQLNMGKIWEITDQIRFGETGFAFILNNKGDIMSHPDKLLILSKASPEILEKIKNKEEGVVSYIEKGKEMIGGFTSPSDPELLEKGWKLIVTQSENEALLLVSVFKREIVLVFLGGLALIFFMGFLLSGGIVKPIEKLTDLTKEIAAGKLEAKVKIRTGDEIEELAESFNRMTTDLRKAREALEEAKAGLEIKVKERTKELEEARASLEIKVRARTIELEELAESLDEKVKERTKTLQGKVEELERFHRLTVGRELKMIELKKEIKKLKEELKTKTKQ